MARGKADETVYRSYEEMKAKLLPSECEVDDDDFADPAALGVALAADSLAVMRKALSSPRKRRTATPASR